MKKLIVLLLAILMLFSLAACSGKTEPTLSSSTTDPGASQQQTSDIPNNQNGFPDNADDISGVTGEVTVEGEKVIHTTKDGAGNISVMEYIYDGSALSKIVLTMKCKDSGAAKDLYDQMMGDGKAMTEETYSDVELDGKNVICTMNDGMVATFASFSQDDLASLLRNEPTEANANSGDTVTAQKWSELPLPKGFPKLAEGVTSYTQTADNIISLDWNVMTLEQAEAMLAPMEEWAGAKFEAYGDEAYMNWSLVTDTLNIAMAYFADPGSMSQVSLTISVW